MFAPEPEAVSAETLASISTPDRVDTRIGTLEFFDGMPSAATIDTVYENLDRGRPTARLPRHT